MKIQRKLVGKSNPRPQRDDAGHAIADQWPGKHPELHQIPGHILANHRPDIPVECKRRPEAETLDADLRRANHVGGGDCTQLAISD